MYQRFRGCKVDFTQYKIKLLLIIIIRTKCKCLEIACPEKPMQLNHAPHYSVICNFCVLYLTYSSFVTYCRVFDYCPCRHFHARQNVTLKIVLDVLFLGLWAVHSDGHTSDAAGGQWDWPRVHLCYTQAAAHDHKWQWQGAHTDMSQLARQPSPGFWPV